MNIWIFDHYAIGPSMVGSSRQFDFASELIKSGNKVTIFAASFGHSGREQVKLRDGESRRIEKVDGVSFIWLRTPPYLGNDWRRAFNMLSFFFQVLLYGLKSKEKIDIILASSPHPLTVLAGYLIGKVKKVPFIFEVRDLWPQTFIDVGGYSRNQPIVVSLKLLERFLYINANKVITLLPRSADYITTKGVRDDKIVYIPNGIRPDLYNNKDADLPLDLATAISRWKAQDKFLIGYTGAHGMVDVLTTILDAAELLRKQGDTKINFLLIGQGSEKGKLIQMAKDLDLINVFFFEPVPKTSLPSLLNVMDAVVITKKKSGLYKYGISFLKIFDYMMSSKPIIWAVDSVNNPVSDAKCGISIPPENPEELMNAILKLADMSALERERMGNLGREYVLKNHSTPLLAEKLLKVLQDTINSYSLAQSKQHC